MMFMVYDAIYYVLLTAWFIYRVVVCAKIVSLYFRKVNGCYLVVIVRKILWNLFLNVLFIHKHKFNCKYAVKIINKEWFHCVFLCAWKY